MVITKKKVTGRGRPKKTFALKHKRIAHEHEAQAAGTIRTHHIPRVTNLLNFPSQQRSILYLFIFSVIIFVVSLGATLVKKSNVDKEVAGDLTSITEDTGVSEETTGMETTVKNTEIIESAASSVLSNFYQSINKQEFDTALQNIDTPLKKSNTFKTYFTNKRLMRFLNNLTEGKISISQIQETKVDTENSNLSYQLQYTLASDNNIYTELRSATMIKRLGEYKITSIKCETTGCSRMPFFNPGKYTTK